MRSDNKRSSVVKGSIPGSVPWNWMRGSMVLMMALGIFLAMPSMEVEAAANLVTIDDVTYDFYNEKDAEIDSIPNAVEELTIPASVQYDLNKDGIKEICIVTGVLDSNKLSACASTLETLTIQADVNLDGGALKDCEKLTTVTVTGSGSIGGYLCTKPGSSNATLKTVSITGGNTIQEGAFKNCNELTNLTLKNTTITGNYAFENCTELTNLTLKNTTIAGKEAFMSCIKLTDLTLKNTTITGLNAFRNCDELTNLTLDGVTLEASASFVGCTDLSNVTIIGGCDTIPDSTFASCDSLGSITIPEHVTKIGWAAFGYCTSLQSMTILGSGVALDESVFNGSTALKTVYVTTEEMKSNVETHFSNAAEKKDQSLIYFKNYPTVVTVIIRDSVTEDTREESNAEDDTEKEAIIIPLWEPTDPADIYRHSLLGQEAPIYEELNQHYPIRMINEIQGPQFFEVVIPLKGKTRLARTYNLFVNEALRYTMDLPAKIRLQIPEVLQADGRTFVMYGVTEDGKAYVCKDLDREPSTITFETKRFYAFALGYQD